MDTGVIMPQQSMRQITGQIRLIEGSCKLLTLLITKAKPSEPYLLLYILMSPSVLEFCYLS